MSISVDVEISIIVSGSSLKDHSKIYGDEPRVYLTWPCFARLLPAYFIVKD